MENQPKFLPEFLHKRLRKPLPKARVPGLPVLSATTRIGLLIFGWLAILVGVVTGPLPILQGWMFVALGAASLSLVSRTMLALLRFVMRPWPRGWRYFLRTRRRLLRYISKGSRGAT